MKRLALVTVFAAACGGSGFATGEAMLTGIVPTPMSASATSFAEADGAGTMVMGWKISFWEQGSGADCASNDPHRVAAVSVYTNQPAESGKKAQLEVGEVVIVPESPPTVSGTASATMGAEKIGQITGNLTLSAVHVPDRSLDRRHQGLPQRGRRRWQRCGGHDHGTVRRARLRVIRSRRGSGPRAGTPPPRR